MSGTQRLNNNKKQGQANKDGVDQSSQSNPQPVEPESDSGKPYEVDRKKTSIFTQRADKMDRYLKGIGQ